VNKNSLFTVVKPFFICTEIKLCFTF